VRVEDLNAYWDGLLALGRGFKSPEEARLQLIEEASSSDSLEGLIQQWVLVNDLGQPQLLQLKIWLQLSYAQLAEIFRCSPREIAQWLKAQRSLLLPAYPSSREQSSEPIEGLSCFMVEQYLSQWIDSEVVDVRVIQSMKQHLSLCSDCRARLDVYRELQGRILHSRPRSPAPSENEWNQTIRLVHRKEKRLLIRIVVYVIVVLALAAAGILWLVLAPEKSPNIFELPG